MSIVSLLRSEPRQPERRNFATLAQWVQYIDSFFYGGYDSSAGVTVNVDTALSLTAIWRAINILSAAIAMLPLNLHRRLPRGSEIAYDHPLQRIVHDQPNPWQSSFEYREFLMQAVLMRGNFYAKKDYNRRGQLSMLQILHPDRTTIKSGDKDYYYEFVDAYGRIHNLMRPEISHIRGFSLDGITGVDPLRYHSRAIGISIAQDEHTARTFKNGAVPSGVLTHPMTLSEDAQKGLRESWKKQYGGENKGNIAVLEEGMKFEQLSMNAEDAQLIESRKFSVSDIARIYNVPLHMLSELDRSTNNNIEHQSLEFVTYSLMPWIVRIEMSLKKDLLDAEREEDYFFKFNVKGLLRGDNKSRAEFYNKLVQIGAFSPNDVREWEDMNPVDGGDVLMVPVNMTKLELLGQNTVNNTANAVEKQGNNGADNGGNGENKDGNGDEKEENSLKIGENRAVLPINNDGNSDEIARKSQEFQRNLIVSALQPVFFEAAGRVIRKESQALKRFWKKSDGKIEEFNKAAEEFYVDHEIFIRSVMAPCIESLSRAMSGMNSEDSAGISDGHISISPYIDNLSHRYIEDSKSELSKLILCETIFKDLKSIDLWDDTRSQNLWNEELERLRNFIEVKTDA